MSNRPSALPSILISALALLLVACSGAGASPTPPSGAPASPGGSAGASADPSPTSGSGTIEHPTGADEIILRYDEGGGFVMPAFTASMAPHFTLYGDGRVVFRNPTLEGPPAQGSVFLMNALRTATLSEEQIQELLAFALGDGGLAAARAEYTNDMVADASTAIFTVNAGGLSKTVSVYALGLDVEGLKDAPARAAFARLAQRLIDLDQGGSIPTEVYEPEAFRVTLLDAAGMAAPDIRTWPWDDVAVTDFKPSADPEGPQFPHLTMTAEQLDELDVTDHQGGFQNLIITGPDGKLYVLAARPLLPGEAD